MLTKEEKKYSESGKYGARTQEDIRSRLVPPLKQLLTFDIRDSVDSTNTELKIAGENGGAHGIVMIADEQTGGRGRLGRRFYSPRGTGIYMSVLLCPDLDTAETALITTAASVAAAQAIESVTGKTAAIKWVNDIYVNTYKVCGILTEAVFDPENGRCAYAVLGIGINVYRPEEGFSSELEDIAGALFDETPPDGIRAELIAEFLNRFFGIYSQLPDKTFLKEYRERSLLRGLDIKFCRGNDTFFGRVLDINDEAELVVRLEGGATETFFTGEIAVDKSFLEQLR